MPRDRDGSFEPLLIPKHERRFTGFDDKIVAMYARGMTVREIQGFLLEQYGTEVSPDFMNQGVNSQLCLYRPCGVPQARGVGVLLEMDDSTFTHAPNMAGLRVERAAGSTMDARISRLDHDRFSAGMELHWLNRECMPVVRHPIQKVLFYSGWTLPCLFVRIWAVFRLAPCNR